MEMIGKTTINPLLFYSGKMIGYALWIVLVLELLQVPITGFNPSVEMRILSIIISCCGLLISIVSLFYLGKSTRIGLPVEKTTLKNRGVYRYSRNPMYLGFSFLTIASIIYYHNLTVFFLGIYCLFVYHLIVLNEEKFLEQRFGNDYLEYKKQVRRYL